MTTSTVTLVGDVSDLIGNDYDPSRTKVWVQHNTDKVVTDSGPIRLGAATKAVAADGTFSFANVVASTSLVENLQATLWVDWPNTAGPERTRRQVSFGPYDLTGLSGTVDIRTLEATQALDPVASSAVLSQAQGYRDDAEAARDAAQALVLSDLGTTDGQTRALVQNPASQTAVALSASIDAATQGFGGPSALGDLRGVPAYSLLPQYLAKWRKAMQSAVVGAAFAKLAVVTDSTGQGFGATVQTSWPSVLRQKLNDSGVPASNGLAIYPNLAPDSRWSLGAGWAYSGGVGAAGGSVYGTDGGAGSMTFTPDYPYDTIELHYFSAGDKGVVDLTARGATTSVDMKAPGGGFVKQTFTRSAGTGPIQVHNLAGGEAYIRGFDAYLSTNKSVRVSNLGVSGSSTDTWANGYQSKECFKVYEPDLTLIALGINDAPGTSVATWRANMQLLITAAKVSGDVVLASVVPSANASGKVTREQEYRAELVDLADDNGCPWVDIFGRIGSASSAPAGYYVDDLHLSATGYADLGLAWATALRG